MLWAMLGGATIMGEGGALSCCSMAIIEGIIVGASEYFRQCSVRQLCLQRVGPSSSTQQGYSSCGTAAQLGYYGLRAWDAPGWRSLGPQWAGRGNELCPEATQLCL